MTIQEICKELETDREWMEFCLMLIEQKQEVRHEIVMQMQRRSAAEAAVVQRLYSGCTAAVHN